MPGLVGPEVSAWVVILGLPVILGLVGVRWGVRVGVARRCDCLCPGGLG